MERDVFDRMAELDAEHWWFVGRRRVLSALIDRRLKLPADARILEIGAGTGSNIPMLERFGRLDALEVDEDARRLAECRFGRAIGDAPLPELPGVPNAAYDLVALLDVLEHVEDDLAALRAIRTKLKPGGRVLLAVPANPWMWSAHDVAHHHFRRYTRKSLSDVATRAGLAVDYLGGMNSLLYPVAAGVRLLGKVTRRQGSDDAMPAGPINTVLAGIFGLERHLVGRVSLPLGVSLVALLSDGGSRNSMLEPERQTGVKPETSPAS